MNEIPSAELHVLILSIDNFLMGNMHPNRQVLEIYTEQILIIFLMSNEYCCRQLSSFRQFFGVNLAKPDQQVYFDHLIHPFSPRLPGCIHLTSISIKNQASLLL